MARRQNREWIDSLKHGMQDKICLLKAEFVSAGERMNFIVLKVKGHTQKVYLRPRVQRTLISLLNIVDVLDREIKALTQTVEAASGYR